MAPRIISVELKALKFYFFAFSLLVSSLLSIQPASGTNCSPEISTVSSHTLVAFKTPGTCTWQSPSGIHIFRGLIVAGGGGGGYGAGGGGGGGGYIQFESLTISSEVLTIVVGGGGTGASTYVPGGAGENSEMYGLNIALIARGGSGGATRATGGFPATIDGGSGGGAAGAWEYSSYSSIGTQSSQNQLPALSAIGGYQFGGDGSRAGERWYPGGGGGAGGDGRFDPGVGGDGIENAILGVNLAWAGGGGGSGWSGPGGNGGNGGGGGGAAYEFGGVAGLGDIDGITPAEDGSLNGGGGGTNTGGGGGGGSSYDYGGGNGGSGIVVLRYLTVEGNSQSLISISLPGNPTSIPKGRIIQITATIGVAGRVKFYANSKVIGGCASKSAAITAICSWKPSIQGQSVILTAVLNPTSNNYSKVRSAALNVGVTRRTGLRS